MPIARVLSPALRAAAVLLALFSLPAAAQDDVFAGGWTLEPQASSLRFQSVKNLTKVESSGFAEFEGGIDDTGQATVRIFLDSVDTKIDLRNVRMRFLFFETFQFPEAVITTRLDAAELSDLAQLRRKIIPITYALDLHGVSRTFETEVAVTLISDDMVAVSTTAPISVSVADFALEGGIAKLEEAANVVIVPSATVSFDFVFSRPAAGEETLMAAAAPARSGGASAALEPQGNFDREACKGRFEILSRTDNIYFPSGSARLDARSEPLLESIVDIVSRCPDLVIEVGGHTDSDGSAAANQSLSERRAGAVTQYLVSKAIPAERILTVGYGEARPVASNDTADGKRRNRRIEFVVAE